MKIATWNVNSIKARLPLVIQWLKDASPDVLLLQELKCITEAFPYEEIEDAGYEAAVYGQKTYNGVAILSKIGIEDVICGNEYFDDEKARVIEAVVGGNIRIVNVYCPNGQAVDSDAYIYKIEFYKGLRSLLENRLALGEALLIGGDFNIAPTDKDVYDPEAFKDKLLCSTLERQAYRSLLNLGLYDVLREKYPTTDALFTWWDYRKGGFARNHGLRIDHLLVSAKVMESLQSAGVDTDTREQERPSDHAPVWMTF